jgi:mRNA interferase MazF
VAPVSYQPFDDFRSVLGCRGQIKTLENTEPSAKQISRERGFIFLCFFNLNSYASGFPTYRFRCEFSREVLSIMNKSILRGDLYYADLNPVVGSEQGGIRPVLVIQNDVGNRHSPTIIIAAITSKTMKATLPTHCVICTHTGIDRDSIVLLEQIRTIDKRRLKDCIGALGKDDMSAIDKALAVSVGISGRV